MGAAKSKLRNQKNSLRHKWRRRFRKQKRPLTPNSQNKINEFKRAIETFETNEEIQDGLHRAGLESSQLIIGIDFTKSNEWTGRYSFEGKCLHEIEENKYNPYEETIINITKTLSKFDDNGLIHCYGFGDLTTHDYGVFSFFENDGLANGIDELLNKYRSIAPYIKLSGPTSFAPIIHQAMRIVIANNCSYHILLIIADGTVTNNCLKPTIEALEAASRLPLSIILVGVGDGPWDDPIELISDYLSNRIFNNFHFLEFNKILNHASIDKDDFEKRSAYFAAHALMEIPEQYKIAQALDLFNPENNPFHVDLNRKVVYPLPVLSHPHDNNNIEIPEYTPDN